MIIGKRIKSLRLEKGITQDKLATYLNLSYQAISKWENDETQPDISLLVPIANYFDVSLDYLLGNECSQTFYQTRREKLQSIYELDRTDDNFRLADIAYKSFIENGNPTAKDYWYYAYLYDVRATESIRIAKNLYLKAINCLADVQEEEISNAYEELCRLLINCNQKEEAQILLEKWIARDKENVYPYIQLANFYNYIGEPKQAFDYIEKAQLLEIDTYQLYMIMGEVFESLGKNSEAIEAWNKSYKLNSNIARALYNIAHLYENIGEYNRAIDTYNQIVNWHIEREPDAISLEYPRKRIFALQNEK